jgi:uncharacterized phage-associated protein
MIGIDDQFKYDFTEWYILIVVMYSFGIFLAIYVTKLIKQSIQDEEQEHALDFLVRQAEQHGLYEIEAKTTLIYKSEEQGDKNK